jgi:O-antigen/teichoic acid export membrane protein
MFVMMIIGLYTSRVILNVLGVNDYGTYNVVGGVVSMFSLLTAAMSSSISRFLTFELGKGDMEQLKKVFSTSLNVQIIMSVIVIVAVEVIGVWFLNYKMNIPEGRIEAANWVMQCSLLTFVAGLLMSPYNASIISHERMTIYAYVSIWDAIMKLVIVFALYISPFDKLKSYAILLLCVSLMTTSIYWIYCKRHFEECTYHRILDKKLLKEITSYAGWGVVGDGAWILNTQGVNILINLYFGVTLNAARGVATTVDNMIQQFVRNFMVALNPQITKSYAVGDYEYMHKLVFFGSKYSYFLMLFFIIPICTETKLLLTLWLKIVPNYAVIFTQLSLVTSMCVMLSNTLTTSIAATGKIRDYQLVVGLMSLSIFPMTWIAFELGLSPISCYIIYLLVFFAMIFVKVKMVAGKIHMSGWDYVRSVLLKTFLVTVLSLVIPLGLCLFQDDSIWRLVEICVISPLCTLLSVWFVGMNKLEKDYIFGFVKKRFKGH